MQASFSRDTFPNGGWQFHEAWSNWDAPRPKSDTFTQTVQEIIKHRLKNPAAIIKNNLSTDPAAVGNELEAYTRARLGMPQLSPKMTPPPQVPQMSGAVLKAVAAVKKLATGAAIILEWEESGLPPEPAEVSEKRAAICATCPQNDKNKSITELFTVPTAEKMKQKFERLRDLKLETSHDQELKVCQACLCPLQLKVHCPMPLIQKRLKPEQRAELDPRCWILAG